jgi:hypothetical protein
VAMKDFIKYNVVTAGQTQPEPGLELEDEWCLGVEGSFGSHHVSPRGLTTHLLRKLVCVEGIVTKCMRLGFIHLHYFCLFFLLLACGSFFVFVFRFSIFFCLFVCLSSVYFREVNSF